MPISTIGGVLFGTLEGHHRFALVNLLQVAGALLAQLAPLAAYALWGPSLAVLIPTVIASRALILAASAVAAARALPIGRRADW